MTTITIDIACPGKQRPRWGQGQTYTPAKTRAYEKRIGDEYRIARGAFIDGPVSLTIEAAYAPPSSWSKKNRAAAIGTWKETKPDLDNIVKLVKDALNGVAYVDDKLVTDLAASKVWGESNALVITIKPAWRPE